MDINEIFSMYFGIIEDTRCECNIIYPLIDILKVILIGVLCGMDELDKIADYGENKKEFLSKEFKIEKIPSKATLTRVVAMVNPRWLGISMVGILRTLIKEKHKQIMLDGKVIRSTDAIKTIERMMNIVTAYTDTGISLGQITVDEKSNEIPAVRELIEMLDIQGAVLTMDAMHCQKETMEKIINNKGNYVVQIKANQGNFYEDVEGMFDDRLVDINEKDGNYDIYETIEKNKGRIEKRTCYVLEEVAYFTDYIADWKGLDKIFAIKREIEREGKTSKEISYYLSSKSGSAKELMGYARKHWEIESMHHILDVTYDEDRCKLLTKKAQENINIFRKIGISIHKNYLKDKKQTIKSSMFNCLLDEQHILEILQFCHNR